MPGVKNLLSAIKINIKYIKTKKMVPIGKK